MIMKKNTSIARFAILVFTAMCSLPMMAQEENMGFHQALKTKFIEGNAGFMSLVAIALIVGLAFCIERIIYLSLSEINAKKLMQDIDQKFKQNKELGSLGKIFEKLMLWGRDDFAPKSAGDAKKIVADYKPEYPSIKAYFEAINDLFLDKDAVTYDENGNAVIDFQNTK